MTNSKSDAGQRPRQLAAVADLALPPSREEAVAAILDSWLLGANELSRKMRAPAYQTLVPATVFAHPRTTGDEVAP